MDYFQQLKLRNVKPSQKIYSYSHTFRPFFSIPSFHFFPFSKNNSFVSAIRTKSSAKSSSIGNEISYFGNCLAFCHFDNPSDFGSPALAGMPTLDQQLWPTPDQQLWPGSWHASTGPAVMAQLQAGSHATIYTAFCHLVLIPIPSSAPHFVITTHYIGLSKYWQHCRSNSIGLVDRQHRQHRRPTCILFFYLISPTNCIYPRKETEKTLN